MTTLQLRRHQLIVAQLEKESHRREELIAKLIRSDGKLQKLKRAVARSSKRLVEGHTKSIEAAKAWTAPEVERLADDPIPTFLDRRNLMADPKTKDKKAERRAIEKEKLAAKLTGKLKKMPLTGKAALDFINAG